MLKNKRMKDKWSGFSHLNGFNVVNHMIHVVLSSKSFQEKGMTLVGPNKHIRTHPLDQQPWLDPKPEQKIK